MLITKEWLDAHRTDRGAWTLAQMQALGVHWPMPAGWRDALYGIEIDDETAKRFEAGKSVLSKSAIKQRAKHEVAMLQAMGREVPQQLMAVAHPPQPQPGPKAIRRAERKNARKAAKVAALAAKLVKPKPLGKSLPAVVHRPPPVGPRVPRCPDPNSDEFLSSYAWRQVRMQALKKYGPVCMCCGASPATGAVVNVDHIKPRRLFPQLALDIDNLQILCGDCNHGKGNWDQTDWRPEEYEPEAVAHLRLIAKNG